jgi:hypothetical protein
MLLRARANASLSEMKACRSVSSSMPLMKQRMDDMRVRKSDMDVSADDKAVADFMRDAVQITAGKRGWSDTIDLMVWKASQVLGVTPRRARSFWERSAKKITAKEYLTAQARVAELRQRAKDREHELQALAATRARTAAALVGGVERPDVDHVERLGPVVDRSRGQD